MIIKIISQYYAPDNFLINEISSALVEMGNQVDVLTGLPDYATSKIPKEYKRFKKRREVIDGVKVERVSTIERRKGVVFRALNYGSFVLTASLKSYFARTLSFNVLFVYQLSPVLQAIPAIVFKKRTGKKLVLYCCDLWPESMKAWGIKESSLLYKLIKRISKSIYCSCDIVAITSTPFRQYLVDVCGVNAEKIVYLPQHSEDTYKDIAGVYQDNDCIDFLFAGNIGAVQDLDCILHATAELEAELKFCVHIVGDGSELENLKNLSQKLGLGGKVKFWGRYPAKEMISFYKMADCFLLTLRGGDFIGMTLPSKAQGYLSAGKPVAAAIDGAGYELIKESDCGEAVKAGDYNALAEAMRAIINNFDNYKQKGINGRKFYETHFTKKIFMDSLVELLKED